MTLITPQTGINSQVSEPIERKLEIERCQQDKLLLIDRQGQILLQEDVYEKCIHHSDFADYRSI